MRVIECKFFMYYNITILQLWSHMYRKDFHASVNTDNFTESFNNVLKNHYLTLCHDKSVYSLTKILLHCVFPDQEREYVILTARQSSARRQSRNVLLHFLLNRPAHVQNACISNIEKGRKISPATITEVSSKDGVFKMKSRKGNYEVSIVAGSCSCLYFSRERIPCKHMFNIFVCVCVCTLALSCMYSIYIVSHYYHPHNHN